MEQILFRPFRNLLSAFLNHASIKVVLAFHSDAFAPPAHGFILLISPRMSLKMTLKVGQAFVDLFPFADGTDKVAGAGGSAG